MANSAGFLETLQSLFTRGSGFPLTDWQKNLLINYITKSPHLGYSPGMAGGKWDKVLKGIFEHPTVEKRGIQEPSTPPKELMDLYNLGFGRATLKDPRNGPVATTGLDPSLMLKNILADRTYAGDQPEGMTLPQLGTLKSQASPLLPQTLGQLQDYAFHTLVGDPVSFRMGESTPRWGTATSPFGDWDKSQKQLAQTMLGFHEKKEQKEFIKQKRAKLRESDVGFSAGTLGTWMKKLIKGATQGAVPGIGDILGWEDFDWEEWLRQHGGGLSYSPSFFGGY